MVCVYIYIYIIHILKSERKITVIKKPYALKERNIGIFFKRINNSDMMCKPNMILSYSKKSYQIHNHFQTWE
jgi:hypothetical protein